MIQWLSVQVPALSAILGKPPVCAVITDRGRYTLIRLSVAVVTAHPPISVVAVYVAPVADFDHQDNQLVILNCIDDSPIAYPDPV